MEIEEIKTKLSVLNKEYDLKEKELKNSPNYTNLHKKWKLIGKEIDELYEKEQEAESIIYDKFLDDERKNPRYLNTENDSRNIRQEVLNSIKRGSGIKNLSLLKAKDIERIVEKLIDKELSENEELRNLKKERYSKESARDKISKEMEKMKKELNPIEREISELNRKKWDAERREEKAKEMADSKKRGYFKFEARKQEAKKKLRENFNDIIEKVRLEVTKEKILMNLEDEEN